MIFETETFTSLLHNKAHWEFEIFLILLFDGLLGCLIWPFLKRHWGHHVARDKEDVTQKKAGIPFSICSCGKPITNITDPKFHGTHTYWRDAGGFVCVDNHWHAPRPAVWDDSPAVYETLKRTVREPEC
jgi:hypothetical protein